MQSIIQHPTLGTIVYDESFWTGKKTISVNGVQLIKQDKKTFLFPDNREGGIVRLSGNFFSGVKLFIGNESIQVTSSPKWYEYVCSALIFITVLIWGNSVTLVSIFPIVGGAVGGAISGVMTALNLYAMKAAQKWWIKLLIWIGIFAATIMICFVLALVFIAALT